MSLTFREDLQEVNVEEQILNNLIHNDDTVLSAESERDVQLLLDRATTNYKYNMI